MYYKTCSTQIWTYIFHNSRYSIVSFYIDSALRCLVYALVCVLIEIPGFPRLCLEQSWSQVASRWPLLVWSTHALHAFIHTTSTFDILLAFIHTLSALPLTLFHSHVILLQYLSAFICITCSVSAAIFASSTSGGHCAGARIRCSFQVVPCLKFAA